MFISEFSMLQMLGAISLIDVATLTEVYIECSVPKLSSPIVPLRGTYSGSKRKATLTHMYSLNLHYKQFRLYF